jgi:hypothetical protein
MRSNKSLKLRTLATYAFSLFHRYCMETTTIMYRDSESTYKLEALEPRVLLSADPVGVAVEDAMDATGVEDTFVTSEHVLFEESMESQMDAGVSGELDDLFDGLSDQADDLGASDDAFGSDLSDSASGFPPDSVSDFHVDSDEPSLIVEAGEILDGNQIIEGDVVAEGTVSPGNSPGIIEV